MEEKRIKAIEFGLMRKLYKDLIAAEKTLEKLHGWAPEEIKRAKEYTRNRVGLLSDELRIDGGIKRELRR